MIRETALPLAGAACVGEDARAAVRIWRACFGGEEAAHRLLEECPAGRLLVCREEETGEAAAMLFLLPMALHGGGGPPRRGQYLYAAGTLPVFRGLGLMGALVRRAVSGAAFTALLPAEESLYGYYARFGFAPALRQSRLVFSAEELEREAWGAAPPRVFPPDEAELLARRRLNCRGALLWGGEMLPFVLGDFRRSGGEILLTAEDYALCLPGEGGVTVCECSLRNRRGLAALLRARYAGAARFELRFPGRAPGARSVRYGMVHVGRGEPPFPDETYFSLAME